MRAARAGGSLAMELNVAVRTRAAIVDDDTLALYQSHGFGTFKTRSFSFFPWLCCLLVAPSPVAPASCFAWAGVLSPAVCPVRCGVSIDLLCLPLGAHGKRARVVASFMASPRARGPSLRSSGCWCHGPSGSPRRCRGADDCGALAARPRCPQHHTTGHRAVPLWTAVVVLLVCADPLMWTPTAASPPARDAWQLYALPLRLLVDSLGASNLEVERCVTCLRAGQGWKPGCRQLSRAVVRTIQVAEGRPGKRRRHPIHRVCQERRGQSRAW